MTAAIDWIKARTTIKTEENLTVEGVEYAVETDVFSGHLPRQMIRDAAKATLEKGDFVNEVLVVHVKSGFTEYSRTTYTPTAAA